MLVKVRFLISLYSNIEECEQEHQGQTELDREDVKVWRGNHDSSLHGVKKLPVLSDLVNCDEVFWSPASESG